MDDATMPVFQIVPVIALAVFGIWYGVARGNVVSSHNPAARIISPMPARPNLFQESFTGFCVRTWFLEGLVYGLTALLRWLGGEPDIAGGLIHRTPLMASIYGYMTLAYLARDIWRVRKPAGALLTGRGGWAGIKAAHADAYAARSMPRAA